MRKYVFLLFGPLIVIACFCQQSFAQQTLTWPQVREKFLTANPTLQAGRIGVDQSRAQQITAHLRPNPMLSASTDYIHPFQSHGALEDVQPSLAATYLVERMNKRGLRLESAKKGTDIAVSQLADQERNLLFTLRGAFIQILQQKAVLDVAKENLSYYDKVLQVSADRYQAGDIPKVDLERLQLQRVQFESDIQTATVNLRTSKIQLLTLMNDRTPVDAFDVTGPFDFTEDITTLENFRAIAIDTRPDLKAAIQSIDQAKTNRQLAEANASTDPIIGFDVGRFPQSSGISPSGYMGVSVSIPFRIFDRNQGERLRTRLDITRTERIRAASEAQVFSDVDSAYAVVNSTIALLRPYKTQYLQQASSVRDTMTFAYERGAASLLDFLGAQRDYRSVRLAYLNLIGSYLTAAAQLNFSVGREVIE
jgi:outer membrane protein, heavy metal efflux system